MRKTIDEAIVAAEQEQIAVFAALGKAIARWSRVEWHLCQVFCISLGTPESKAATASFFALQAFHAKLEVTERAFQSRFTDIRLLAQWMDIAEQARKRSKSRNHLAHSPVMFAPQRRHGRRSYIEVGAFSDLKPSLGKRSDRTAYYLADITQVDASFEILTNDLARFYHSIEHHLEQNPAI